MLEAFVTCVLNTPCTLISAPEINAIKNPIMGSTFLFLLSLTVSPMIGKICALSAYLEASICSCICAASSCTSAVTSAPFHTLENRLSSCTQKFPVSIIFGRGMLSP